MVTHGRRPATWEVHDGTDLMTADDRADPDVDGLTNRQAFERATDTAEPDTDDGGESDGSEDGATRCPLDLPDDDLPPPLDVDVVIDLGDEDGDVDLDDYDYLPTACPTPVAPPARPCPATCGLHQRLGSRALLGDHRAAPPLGRRLLLEPSPIRRRFGLLCLCGPRS
jgi:hypothetical protein